MFSLEKIIRPNILYLQPYSSARDEFFGTEGIFLDANENPFGQFNRYPDPLQKLLKQQLSQIKSIPTENIFLGNGSDEIIDLCFRIFCEPSKDKAMTFVPTYGMYTVSAAINNIELIKVNLNDEFQINKETVLPLLNDSNLKLIFICSPNNPTGNTIKDVTFIIENFNGIVIIDEAYIDFSTRQSFMEKIEQYPNVIILQTLSKAWGLATARIGIAFTNTAIIHFLNKVKPPYNISALNQEAALSVLNQYEKFLPQKERIIKEKEKLEKELQKLPFVIKIYPSETNFLLVEVIDADLMYQKLIDQNIIIRNRNKEIKNCLRITIGTPKENTIVLDALKKFKL